MSDPEGLARRRYRLLLEQLLSAYRDEHGGSERGFKTDAGRKLGIAAQYVGMILDDLRPDAAPIEQALKGMRLDPAFFYDPTIGDAPDHRDYVQGTRVERERVEMPAVRAYFEKHPEHERFRDEVNATLNASSGDVKASVVVGVVRGLLDEEMITERIRGAR